MKLSKKYLLQKVTIRKTFYYKSLLNKRLYVSGPVKNTVVFYI